MKPFASTSEMIETHERMFGPAGRTCAELVCRHVKLFDEPLESLNIRLVLVPFEIGPYNRHAGYIHAASFHFIVGNRHICGFDEDGVVLHKDGWYGAYSSNATGGTEDFIVHELTHYRQGLLVGGDFGGSRGVHRDVGWYGAIREACPRYFGVWFPESIWPKLKSVRKGRRVTKEEVPERITEVEATHWPHSFRELIAAKDPRFEGLYIKN